MENGCDWLRKGGGKKSFWDRWILIKSQAF